MGYCIFWILGATASSGLGPLIRCREDTLGGHFYAVNGHFSSTVIDYMDQCEARSPGHIDGGPASRDGVYNNLRRLRPETRVFLSILNLALQRSSRTDISETHF